MKRLMIAVASLAIPALIWATVNQIQIAGNYNATQTDITYQKFQESLVPDPGATGQYPVTWLNNTGTRYEIIVVGAITPSTASTDPHMIVTRGTNSTTAFSHDNITYMNISVASTYTATNTPTLTATATATATLTITPIPRGTAITTLSGGTPVPLFISNPGTTTGTVWNYALIGTNPYNNGGYVYLAGADGNTLTAQAAVTFGWSVK
jgi:hypothetical protein